MRTDNSIRMIREECESPNGKDEDCSVPAFGVSGQFMMTSEEKARPSEDFNPRKIVALTLDDSLARLFECLTLEYSGSILLTPKWKNFRSQKLKFAEKTRINNAIWRSWHIQFQLGQHPLFCQFDNPLTEMAKPPRPMTLMVEGRYWKSKLEVVAAEYQKWRVFYKQMVEDKFQDVELQHQTEEILRLDQEISDNLREREREREYNTGPTTMSSKVYSTRSPVSLVVSQALEMVESCNLMESMVFSLPDTLFTSLDVDNQRTAEWASGTFKDTADTVQPTLDTLQPSLEAMTPVLDELIEQLEASMKGTDFNLDFSSFDKNMDLGFNQTSTAQETMDHSGRYNEPYTAVCSLPSSGVPAASWPMQSSGVPSQAIFDGNLLQSRPEAASAVWSSSPGIHARVLGAESVGTEMRGSFAQDNTARRKSYAGNSTSVVELVGSHAPSPVTTSRPYVPASAVDKRNVGRRYTSAAGSPGKIPRNSSDSQLYSLANPQVSSSPLRSQSVIPVEVQAPNLVAQLKLTKPRHPLMEEKPKRPRMPRNKSAPGLASLGASAQLKKAPQAGGVSKRMGRIPRNRSDSALTSLLRQSEQGTGRQRRGSESSDCIIMTSSPTAGSRTTHVFPKQELLHHDAACATAGSPSNLVQEMVSQLVSSGVSMEEILSKLGTLGSPVTVQQPQLGARQVTSLTNAMPVVCRDFTQHTSFSRTQFTSSFASTATITTPAKVATPSDPPKAPASRNRRKPQAPRPSLKNARTESPAVADDSGFRSTDDIIQNILKQNQMEVPIPSGSAPMTTIDPSDIRESTTVQSIPRWGNPDSVSMFKPNRAVDEGGSGRTLSSPVAAAGHVQHVSFPTVFQMSSGEVVSQDSTTVDKQFSGFRISGAPNSGFASSKLINIQSAVSMAIAQDPPASSSTQTEEENQVEDATSIFGGNYKAETETMVRSRPLTKTLPKEQYMERRRMVHVSAEQKRRGNIKMGFDQLIDMVPSLTSQGNSKISKASILRKSVDYILQIHRERESMQLERDHMKIEIENLNSEISVCQQQLPETGVMVERQDCNEMESLFNHYVQLRSEQNPKFWIFSVMMRPLFDAYNSTVTTANTEEFCRTVISWLNQSCSLPKLRPSVLSSLRELSKTTSILTNPAKLPEQARLAASCLDQQTRPESRLR